MGRGRAKAKQVKVARQLKYKSDDTDLDRLRAELGVGMTAVVGRDSTGRALDLLAARGVPAWVLGEVVPGSGTSRLDGTYRP